MIHRATGILTREGAAVLDCAAGVAVGARACDRTAGSTVAAKPRVIAGGAVRSNAFGAAVGPVAGMLAPIARTLDHTAVGFRATVVVARASVTLANDNAPGGAVVGAAGVTICTGACDQVTGSTVAARPRVGAGVTVDSYARSLTVGSVASMLAPVALAADLAVLWLGTTVQVVRAT